MGNWHGNCTLIVKLRIAPALSCRQRQERRSMSDMRTSSNHSKNDSSTDDSNHKIIIVVCGLANLRCSAGCRLDSACGKHERNGFLRVHYVRARAAMYVYVHSHPQGPSVFLKCSLRANRGGGSSDEKRDFKIKRDDGNENVA